MLVRVNANVISSKNVTFLSFILSLVTRKLKHPTYLDISKITHYPLSNFFSKNKILLDFLTGHPSCPHTSKELLAPRVVAVEWIKQILSINVKFPKPSSE